MQTYKNTLDTILRSAGTLLLKHRDAVEVALTKTEGEIVTPADIAANDLVVSKLLTAYPEIPIYSEEGSANKSEAPTRWIVDPLDGTTPWVSGNSGFSISIALEENGEVVIGAVYDPVMEELYYAEKDHGATKNGQPIFVHPAVPMDAFVVVDWGNKQQKREEGLRYFSKFLVPDMFARQVVPQFAPALGLCHIAEGRIHALVCNDTWVEDHSAGALILTEAGGHCSNFYEQAGFSHRTPGIIAAASRDLHHAISALLRQ